MRPTRLLAALVLGLPLLAGGGTPLSLSLDATDAPRHVLHAKLRIPASPGPLSLLYPKWIPGEHGPTGPLQDLVGLHFRAGGQELAWRRDDVEMFEFHLTVPPGAKEVEVSLDFLTPSGGNFSAGPSATQTLSLLSWNTVLLYPKGVQSDDLMVEASLRLPEGWKFATALPMASGSGAAEHGNSVSFKPVSLTTLVDSPVITGRHFRRVDLGEDMGRPHFLDMVADSDSSLAITAETTQHLRNLVKESGALFGARHYRHYDFLLTLSDSVAHFGLEHHESSDDRLDEKSMVDPNLVKLSAGLLPHEMVHSWNGKFRRPAGLATGNFEAPMKGELLWVYEGLTQYLGFVLTVRSGLNSPQDTRDELALLASYLDHRPGRLWRPLEDTAVEAQILYNSPSAGGSYRRSVDFYDESLLMWLDADTLIREKTKGQKSLDDFCKAFHGAPSGDPTVKAYGLDEVVRTLNQVAPHDWAGFLHDRVSKVTPHPPLDGLARGGWKLVYGAEPSAFQKMAEGARHGMDLSTSAGFSLNDKGAVGDVLPGSAAAAAGLLPGMTILAVNDRVFSMEALREAVTAAVSSKEPIQLSAKDSGFVKQLLLDYHGGERCPRLERVDGTPDRLSEIFYAKGK